MPSLLLPGLLWPRVMTPVIAEMALDHIELDLQPRERELLADVPGGRWLDGPGRWAVPLTWGACQALRGVFGERLTIGPDLRDWARNELAERVRPCLALRDAADAPGTEDLWPKQRVGSQFLLMAGSALLADDMGAGKTRTVADALVRAAEVPSHALPALVVAPLSVKRQWRDEITARAPHLRTVVVPSGPVGKRRDAILSGADVVICHWDQVAAHSRLAPWGNTKLVKCEAHLSKLAREEWASAEATAGNPFPTVTQCEVHDGELNQVTWRTIIADEAHRMCSPANKWTRAMWWLGDHGSNHRWLMTGTPMESSLGDLWSLLHFVSPEEWPSKVKFIERYCRTGFSPWGGVKVFGLLKDNEAEFRAIFEPRYIRRLLREVAPQVPEPIFEERRVELPAKLRRPYDDVARQGVAMLGDAQLVAWDPLTELTRLTQLASASLVDDGPNEEGKPEWRVTEPSPKLDELLVVLAELGSRQVVVFAQSKQLLVMAEKRLDKAKVTHASIRGGVSESDREAGVDLFNAGEARVLLITLGAGAEGLNLGTADTLIFLQRSWSFKKNRQAMHRIVRPGSERHDRLLIIDIIADDTVEEANLSRYQSKLEKHEAVFQDAERMARFLADPAAGLVP